MRVNFPKTLLLILGAAGLRASLTSRSIKSLSAKSERFDTVIKRGYTRGFLTFFSPFNVPYYVEHRKHFQLTSLRLKRASIIDEVIDDFEVKCLVAPYYGKKKELWLWAMPSRINDQGEAISEDLLPTYQEHSGSHDCFDGS